MNQTAEGDVTLEACFRASLGEDGNRQRHQLSEPETAERCRYTTDPMDSTDLLNTDPMDFTDSYVNSDIRRLHTKSDGGATGVATYRSVWQASE